MSQKQSTNQTAEDFEIAVCSPGSVPGEAGEAQNVAVGCSFINEVVSYFKISSWNFNCVYKL